MSTANIKKILDQDDNEILPVTCTAAILDGNSTLESRLQTDEAKLVPTGGTTGQVLAKHSNTNNDVEWVTPSSGGSYTAGDGIDITNGEVSVDIDSSNSNGLSVSSNGLALATATPSSGGTGGTAGSMSAEDKEKLNGVAAGAEVNVQSDWSQTNTSADDYIKNKPTIPTVGTLDTTAATSQTTSSSESLEGNVTLHKVSKTGDYGDLLNKPTIPTVNDATLTIKQGGTTKGTFSANASSDVTINLDAGGGGGGSAGTLDTTATTAQTPDDDESLGGSVTLHKVSKTGDYGDLLNKPTIPSISGLAVDSEVVHKTGNETIGGSKTFSSGVTFGYNIDFSAKNVHQHEIVVSNTDIATGDDEAILGFEDADSGGYVMLRGVAEPSSNYDAANKKYVDDIVGDIETLLAAI